MTGTEAAIRPATQADLPAVEALLTANGLILDDVAAGIEEFLVAEAGGRVVGTIGLEVHAPYALLRSAAVEPARHRNGLGGRLVQRLVDRARARGVRALFLFTPSAAAFFERHGFRRTTREDIPEALRRTGQYTHACGATAVTMTRELT